MFGTANVPPDSGPPIAGELATLLVSPSDHVYRCGSYDSCGARKMEVENTAPMAEYTNGACQLTESCGVFPTCLGEDGQEELLELAKLTLDQMMQVSDWVLSGHPSVAVEVLRAFPDQVQLVDERKSIQLLSCDRSIIANLPLTDEPMDFVRAQQE